MGIPDGYSRNVFSGHLPGGEIFGWSLWVSEAPIGQAAAATQAAAVATAFKNTCLDASILAPTTFLSADGGYDNVIVYSYENKSGKASEVAQAAINLPGTGLSNKLPNQVAACVSLRSATAGRNAQGRVFLPVDNYSLTTGGQFVAADANRLGLFVAKLCTAINNACNPGKVVVLSQTKGASYPVVSTRIDTRLDIQRRRANRQPATSSSTNVVI